MELHEELTDLLRKHNRGNDSNTPDSVLAEYMLISLAAFEKATEQREACKHGPADGVCLPMEDSDG